MAKLKLALCTLGELDDPGSKGFSVPMRKAKLDLFLVRKENKVHAYLNRCPHTGAPLDWNPDRFLDEHDEFIMCANHAALFEIETGLCVAGPCVNTRLQPADTGVEDGVVFIWY